MAMKLAASNGHKLFICTGRPLPDIEKQLRNLNPDGYILSCGAGIQIKEKKQ